MFRLLFLILLICVFCLPQVNAQDTAISTQGIELDESVVTSKPEPDWINDRHENRNRTKKYLKVKQKVEKQNLLRNQKLKELEYYEKRLEQKQQKLEQFNSNEEKGEQE